VAAGPDWWTQRGVLVTEAASEDYALVNQGQLKQMALGAFEEIQAKVPGGAGASLIEAAAAWSWVDSQNIRRPRIQSSTEDYAPANAGQVRWLAKPFYDRLIEVGRASGYPWPTPGEETEDYALANIGQVKNLFAFDLGPGTPSGLSAASTDGGAELRWSPVPGATAYKVLRSTRPGGDYSEVPGTPVTGTEFSETGLTNGALYYFVVAAGNGTAWSFYSQEVEVRIGDVRPAPPHPIRSVALNRRVFLYWDDVPEATAYRISRRTAPDTPPVVFSSASGQFTDTAVLNNVSYLYTIQSTNGFGPGPDSAPVTVTPAEVLAFQDTNADKVDDAWAVQHFESANFATAGDADSDGLSNVAEYQSGSDPNNADFDGDGIHDGEDPEPSVAQPAQPLLTVIVPDEERLERKEIEEKDVDYTRIQLHWEQWQTPANTTEFVIEQRISTGEWKPFATRGAGVGEMDVSGLLAEQNYYFRITAVNTLNGRIATSSPSTAAYQLPLFRAMSVSLSQLTRSKPGFKEFAVDSVPPPAMPKYYLVKTEHFDRESTGNYSALYPYPESGTTTRTRSASWEARFTPNEYTIRAGGALSYSESRSSQGSGGWGPWVSSLSESGSEELFWFEQARGKNNTTFRAEATESSSWRREAAGTDRFGTSSQSRSGKSGGGYELNQAFITEPEKLRWLGYEFDLDQGRLEHSGSSHYDTERSDKSSIDGAKEAYSETTAANTQVDANGRWTGTRIVNRQWDWYGQRGSNSEQIALYQPAMSAWWLLMPSMWIDLDFSWVPRDVSPTRSYQRTDGSLSDPNSSGSSSASLLAQLSEEFTTPDFIRLAEYEMPDWPEPVYNFYGWGRYGWGNWGWDSYLTHNTSSSGWWLAQRQLSKTEESYRLRKSRFQLHTNPSAGVPVKWHLVFVPEDDPETEEDESEESEVVDSLTWQAPPAGGSSPLKTVDPSEWAHGNGNYYLTAPPRLMGYDDSQGAGSVSLDWREKISVGTTMYETTRSNGAAQAAGQTSAVYESSFWLAPCQTPGATYKLTWQDPGITVVYSCYDEDRNWVERRLRSGDSFTEEELVTSNGFRVQADPTQIQRLDFLIQIAATSRDGKSFGDDAIKTKILPKAELRVDANRDGEMTFGNPWDDQTTRKTPYRFWINDDQDNQIGVRDSGEVVPAQVKDSADEKIQSPRDCEDLTRVWINLKGFTKFFVNGQITMALRMREVASGEPSLHLFRALTPGLEYLREEGIAHAQSSAPFHQALGGGNGDLCSRSTAVRIDPEFWGGLSEDNPVIPLLLEGVTAGIAELSVEFYESNNGKIAESPGVWLDLREARDLYARVRATPEHPDEKVALPLPYRRATTFNENHSHFRAESFTPPADEAWQALIFVHGSNELEAESRNRAETIYKRLWHQGYKGRLVFFHWDTLVGYDDGEYPLGQYNMNEYVALKYGPALMKYRATLPQSHQVHVIAHSLGNGVVGSALKSGMAVNNYLMMQAAFSAKAYNAGLPTEGRFKEAEDKKPTPDGMNEKGYAGYLHGVQANIINMFNADDFALATGAVGPFKANWEANQLDYKPDDPPGVGRYSYDSQNQGSVSYTLSETTRKVGDPHESMAFIARTRTKAVGALPSVGGVVSREVNLGVAPYNFGRNRADHSAQFNRNIQQTDAFYKTVFDAVRATP
jgi:hypothetical protein